MIRPCCTEQNPCLQHVALSKIHVCNKVVTMIRPCCTDFIFNYSISRYQAFNKLFWLYIICISRLEKLSLNLFSSNESNCDKCRRKIHFGVSGAPSIYPWRGAPIVIIYPVANSGIISDVRPSPNFIGPLK